MDVSGAICRSPYGAQRVNLNEYVSWKEFFFNRFKTAGMMALPKKMARKQKNLPL